MRIAFPVLSFLCMLPLASQAPIPAPAALPTTLQNGSFTEGALGQIPKGWFVPKFSREAGYRSEIAEEASLPGKRCAVLLREGTGAAGFGNLMQNVDAAPYRGKRIRLKGQLRLDAKAGPGTAAQMWFRVDREGEKSGFFDNMQERPVRFLPSSAWTLVEIVGDVATDAKQLALGIMLPNGGDKLWIAPLTFEVLGDTPVIRTEGPKALSRQGLENLEAFTRAFNYVRFFHPTDEAAKADWNRVAIEGVRVVEGATSTPDLAKRLQSYFAPYAPSAQFLASGQKPKVPAMALSAAFAVRWSHLGFGQKNPQNAYRSTREYLPVGELVSKGWVEPNSVATLKLGEGLNVWLPSVVFADASKATLPKALARVGVSKTSTLPEPTAGGLGSGEDRATRLGAVALAWGVFQHFYPYFDVVNTDWQAELPKALHSAAQDKNAEAFTHTLARMVAALKDGHGGAYGAEMMGSWTPALGLVMVDGHPIVRFSGESAKAVPPGSRILSLDGEASGIRLAKLKTEISAASDGWMNTSLVREFLGGDANTKVQVRYQLPSGLEGEASLSRDVKAWELKNPSKPGSLTELRAGFWYVNLDRISNQEFEAALPKLTQAKGVVFDLRGYPKTSPSFLQHLTDKPMDSARWNIPIVTQPDGKNWAWNTSGRWTLEPKAPRIAGKVAFLTGGGAISYAESCLGIVEAYKLAEIVGEPTAGTNGNVNPFTLPGGYSISWTGMKVLKHDGSTHHGVGILPTVPVKPSIKGLAEGRDEVLEKGLEVVSR